MILKGLAKKETLYKLIKLDIDMHRIAPKLGQGGGDDEIQR